ncbi:MAG: EscN/YscN/HrcN family type III secretion system ATPase, partial [Mesorhizobium sp.]
MTSPATKLESRLASIVPNLRSGLRDDASRPRKGRVRRVTGTVIHATVEEVRIGEVCELLDPRTGTATKAEVVGL